jgi:hypothetical protein
MTGLALAAAVAVALYSGRGVWVGWRSLAWPGVDAAVERSWSEAEFDHETGDLTGYFQRVSWSFELQRRRFHGSARSGTTGVPGRRHLVRAFAPGASVRVYYDPRDPTRSVLEPGVEPAHALLLAGSLPAAAWFLLLLLR